MKRYSHQMIWLAAVLFVLLQFFLQLSSGIVIGAIMHDMNLSALMAGLLGSSLYFVYTTLQIPVGILFDQKNTRFLIVINVLITSLGCLLFATSFSLKGLFLGRLLIGAGSAFAFVGYSHVLRQHFSLKYFAVLMGVSETLAFIVTVIGMISMGELLSVIGWRFFILGTGVMGFLIAILCWQFIPASPHREKPKTHYGKQLLTIIRNKQAWINGLFVGLSFTVITVFGALWAVPFIQAKLACSLGIASILGSFFFLGAALSCPLFGYLANIFARKPLIVWSCLSTGAGLMACIFWPTQNVWLLGSLLFITGSCCGAYMLAFSIANELAPKGSSSLCTGFTNTLAMLTAPIFQPLIGLILDLSSHNKTYTLFDYQMGISIIPIALFLAGALAGLLPDNKHNFR